MTGNKPQKLPVLRLSWRAYRFVFHHALSLAKLVWLPLLVLLAARAAPVYVMTIQELLHVGTWYWLILPVSLFLFASLIVVNWHRYVLLGPHPLGSFDVFKIGRSELLFLAATAVLTFLTGYAPDLAADMVAKTLHPDADQTREREITSYFVIFLIWPLSLLAFCRFFVFLPIIAIGERLSISRVWHLTRANTFRIFAVFCLTGVLSGIAVSVFLTFLWYVPSLETISSMVFLHPLATVHVVQASTSALTAVFSGAFSATALSLCYRHLTGMEDSEGKREKTGGPAKADP